MYIGRKHVYRNEAGESDGGGGVADTTGIGQAEPSIAPEVIEEAEKMGWTPKDQFRGDPSKWRPADEFVERGKTMLPIVNAKVKKQERQIADLQAGLREFGEFHAKTAQREYAHALATLRQQRADAISSSDGVTFDRVDSEIKSLEKQPPVNQSKQQQGVPSPEFDEWLGRNRWAEDETMQNIGVAVGAKLRSENPGIEDVALLDLVAKEIKQRFPEKFENPRRATAPSVEGGAPAARKGGKGFADMPADARAACERMARNAYSDKPAEAAKFKAQYVKSFFED